MDKEISFDPAAVFYIVMILLLLCGPILDLAISFFKWLWML